MKRILPLLLIGLAACASEPPVYELVVATDRFGEGIELWATDVDTTYWTALVTGEGTPYGPEWSPDGSTLAYAAAADTFRSVHFLKDGVTTRPVVDGGRGSSGGGFSADGRYFLFATRDDWSAGNIWRLDTETGESEKLTDFQDYNTTPIFTADGNGMIHCRQVVSEVDGEQVRNGDLYRTDFATGEVTRLTDAASFDCIPDLSPDGTTVAYHACAEPKCNIMLVDAEGGDVRALVDDEYDNRWPRWSPDGAWIAYTRTADGNSDIWLVRADGTEKRAVTTHPSRDEVADWRVVPE
ncbi:MAG: PD40 domain-containing protein [Rhodothermales bacterium]|nr:PD40 domain-containing protein [Rhodothermales bacterium]MBO6781097.1 PD40 domain-containing protein [Rhodothermales bacterium]